MNLIGNAIKFTFKGSVILRLSIERDNSLTYLNFEVKDTGVGIKDEDKDKIF